MAIVVISDISRGDCKCSIHLFRQFIAALASNFLGFSGGMVLGFSAVLLPQLKDDKAFTYDSTYDSWLASIAPLAMVLGCILSGPILDRYGRKFSLISLVLPFSVGWLMISFGPTIKYLLVGRFITGICAGGYRPMALVYLGEVTDPKYRAMSLISTSLATNIGVMLSHIIGSYINWRIAAIIFCIPIALSVILLVFLKESPLWLVSKGKTNRGTEIFKWYRDGTAAADAELQKVIERQRNNCKKIKITEFFKILRRKSFMKALFISIVIFVAMQFSGVNTLTFYALDLLESTFGAKVDAFLVMIVIDMIRIIGTLIVFVSVKYIPRRPLFLFCVFGTSVFLLGLVLFIYLDSITWLGVTTLVIFIGLSNTIACTAWSFTSELFPNSIRGVGSAITSTVSFLLLFIVVKITPGIVDNFGMSALYLSSAAVVVACAVILCFVLPETNGKSLQEIEDKFNKMSSTSHSTERTKV